jgi:hypothetical protein
VDQATNDDEFTEGLREIAVRRAIGRVETEMQRRVDDIYPPHKRLSVLAGYMAFFFKLDGLSSDARIMAGDDARKFAEMMNRIALFRVAADLQIRCLESGQMDPNRTDFRSEDFWRTCYEEK